MGFGLAYLLCPASHATMPVNGKITFVLGLGFRRKCEFRLAFL